MSAEQPKPNWGDYNKPTRAMVLFAVCVGLFIVSLAVLLETNFPNL